ncbi:MAG: BrnT family toxin [Alphaproteobacteria bacterium]|nr:BrnT family toxin [Alphaproteobacteria bacterium]
MITLDAIVGFDWDEGNRAKILARHNVLWTEVEEVFSNTPLLLLSDEKHSGIEERFHALGHTHNRLFLHLTFTLRKHKTLLRVISARPMNRKERAFYEKET